MRNPASHEIATISTPLRLASHALAPVGRYMTARERTRKAGVTVQFFAFV
jgi:hypothetical protein